MLTLTGTASVADYQTALRSVTYSDPNGTNPTTGPRTISFQVDDGASSNNLSNVVSRTVQVNPNPPPTAGNVSASTDKHTAIDINVLSSASDPDGDTLTVASVNTTGTQGLGQHQCCTGRSTTTPTASSTTSQRARQPPTRSPTQVTDGYHNSQQRHRDGHDQRRQRPPGALERRDHAAELPALRIPAVAVTNTLTHQ